MTEGELRLTTDAKDWARTFCRNFAGRYVVRGSAQSDAFFALDEETLIGWFANAIEVGRSAGEKAAGGPQPPDMRSQEVRSLALMVAGAALGVALQDNPGYVMPTERAIEAVDAVLRDGVDSDD